MPTFHQFGTDGPPYRANVKCHLSWCHEPFGHGGQHLGVPMVYESGMVARRTAGPNATENDHIEETTIELTAEQRAALSIGGPLPSFDRPRGFWGFLGRLCYALSAGFFALMRMKWQGSPPIGDPKEQP